jgi:Phage shock protein A (IM30), suppresses sigma54-dependent transcription
MSFFKLFQIGKNVVEEKIEKVVDSAVDIKREGGALIKQLEGQSKELKSRATKAQQAIQENKSKVEANNYVIEKATELARKQVSLGQDDEALKSLAKVDRLEKINETLNNSNAQLQPIVDKIINNVSSMEEEIQALKDEIDKLDLEEKNYKLMLELKGGDGTINAFSIEDLRARVTKAKCKLEAKEIIDEKLGNDVDFVEKETAKLSVRDRLEALKAEQTK